MLEKLQVRLGPELRAMYPVVVNLGISGDIQLNGPADPANMRLNGAVALESGEVNLTEQSSQQASHLIINSFYF